MFSNKAKRWKSIDELFNCINESSCIYVIMRNYETLHTPELLLNGHEDIDILCDKRNKLLKIILPKKKYKFPYGNQYYIDIEDRDVKVDIRYIGDGYYDKTWERNILNNRILKSNIYVMNQEDYFYSLTYHAIYHKTVLSDEYLKRLLIMSNEIGLSIKDKCGLKKALFEYVREKKYYFTNTKCMGIGVDFAELPKDAIKINELWFLRRKIIEYCSKAKKIVKHYSDKKIIRKKGKS